MHGRDDADAADEVGRKNRRPRKIGGPETFEADTEQGASGHSDESSDPAAAVVGPAAVELELVERDLVGHAPGQGRDRPRFFSGVPVLSRTSPVRDVIELAAPVPAEAPVADSRKDLLGPEQLGRKNQAGVRVFSVLTDGASAVDAKRDADADASPASGQLGAQTPSGRSRQRGAGGQAAQAESRLQADKFDSVPAKFAASTASTAATAATTSTAATSATASAASAAATSSFTNTQSKSKLQHRLHHQQEPGQGLLGQDFARTGSQPVQTSFSGV